MHDLLANVRVDRQAGLPLGRQLESRLLAAIAAGVLRPGDRLPSVRDMAPAAGINVNTVRAVYDGLAAKGYLASRQGSGTFVAPRLPVDDRATRAAELAAAVESSAREAGIDVGDVIGRLYGASSTPIHLPATDEPSLRRYLYAEIERLELELARHPQPVMTDTPASSSPPGRVLSTEELTVVKVELLERLRTFDEARASEIARMYLVREMQAAEDREEIHASGISSHQFPRLSPVPRLAGGT